MELSLNMTVLFLGDVSHPNAQHWISGLKKIGKCEVTTWSLYKGNGLFGRLLRMLHWVWAVLFISRKIRRNNPDILIGYRLTSYGFIAAFSGFKPLVIAAQGETDVWPMNSFSTPFKEFLAKYAIRKADLIHAWGSHMAENIYLVEPSEHKTLVLPRGIDLDLFNCSKTELGGPTCEIVVTRSLYPVYGHEVIIEAVANVIREGIPVKLNILGEGSQKEFLIALTHQLGIASNVTFTGRVTKQDLAEHLRNSDIYISMPATEGVSASLLEAMASGCFPIVSALEANKYWIRTGVNGYLVEIGDWQSLALRILEIYRNPELFKTAIDFNLSLVKKKADASINLNVFMDSYRTLMHKKKS